MPTEHAIWEHLEAVHAGDLDLPAFARWLDATPAAEAVVGPEAWRELVGRDYGDRRALDDTRAQIERLYAQHRPGALTRDGARRVAREFLAGHRDLWRTSAYFAGLWYEGHDTWFPVTFLAIHSDLDGIPAPSVRAYWDAGALQAKLDQHAAWLTWAHQAVATEARRILGQLDTDVPTA